MYPTTHWRPLGERFACVQPCLSSCGALNAELQQRARTASVTKLKFRLDASVVMQNQLKLLPGRNAKIRTDSGFIWGIPADSIYRRA